jgi:FlgD Ig-like domain
LQRVLTTVTLLGLLVLTAAAFAITEHLKLIKSPLSAALVENVRGQERVRGHVLISPTCHGAGCTHSATMRVKLRHAGRVTVSIANSSGHTVRTIASRVPLQAHSYKRFVWNGRTDAGGVVPDGIYHPWVKLTRRSFHFLNTITVDTKPPRVLGVKTAKKNPVLFAGPGRTVAITYGFNEPAHALVYLGPHLIIRSHKTKMHDTVKWAGTLGGEPLRPGKYVLSIGGQDVAGNKTPAARRKQVPVVVRYVGVSPQRVAVRAGHRLTVQVETAAKRYTWRLGNRHGSHRGRVLHLRAPTTPGTYRLVVSENGQSTTAVVRVHG